MKTVKFFCVVVGLCVVLGQGQPMYAAQQNMFDVWVRNGMSPASGSQANGQAYLHYQQRSGGANQWLQFTGAGLDRNRAYHMMGHFGGGTNLVHFADFAPDVSGSISINCLAGRVHLGNWTNQVNNGWGMMNDSWAMFPPGTNNWCDVDRMLGSPLNPTTSSMMGGGGGMGGWGGGSGTGNWGGGSTGSWGGCWGGGGSQTNWSGGGWCWGGTNWWSGSSNWWMNTNSWSSLTNWCWGYTNSWDNWMGSWMNYTNWWTTSAPGPHHPMPLPGYASPVFSMNDLLVVGDDLQPVMLANFASPDSYGYRLRCGLINQGVVSGANAQVQITASPTAMRFRMSATGLTPMAGYYFAINGQIVTNITADAHGRCRLGGLPGGVTNVLSFTGMSILDHNSNPVLNVTLLPQ